MVGTRSFLSAYVAVGGMSTLSSARACCGCWNEGELSRMCENRLGIEADPNHGRAGDSLAMPSAINSGTSLGILREALPKIGISIRISQRK